MKATYIALFGTSFATVQSSYNTGAAAFPIRHRCCSIPNTTQVLRHSQQETIESFLRAKKFDSGKLLQTMLVVAQAKNSVKTEQRFHSLESWFEVNRSRQNLLGQYDHKAKRGRTECREEVTRVSREVATVGIYRTV